MKKITVDCNPIMVNLQWETDRLMAAAVDSTRGSSGSPRAGLTIFTTILKDARKQAR
jgi:hypothetical protein